MLRENARIAVVAPAGVFVPGRLAYTIAGLPDGVGIDIPADGGSDIALGGKPQHQSLECVVCLAAVEDMLQCKGIAFHGLRVATTGDAVKDQGPAACLAGFPAVEAVVVAAHEE